MCVCVKALHRPSIHPFVHSYTCIKVPELMLYGWCHIMLLMQTAAEHSSESKILIALGLMTLSERVNCGERVVQIGTWYFKSSLKDYTATWRNDHRARIPVLTRAALGRSYLYTPKALWFICVRHFGKAVQVVRQISKALCAIDSSRSAQRGSVDHRCRTAVSNWGWNQS